VEFLDAGDQVLVQVRQTALAGGSAIPVESDFWFVFAMREKKIVRLSFHNRRAEALEAAGLTE